MAHEVFVSYSTSDKPIADAVCAALERHGLRCWIAPRDILPGLDWGAAIVDAIGGSRIMVLVFSASANKSPQIKREVERAVHKGVTIIPLRIEDVPLGKTLEYFISSSHWLDAFSPSVEAHLDRLAETVKLLLSRPSRVSDGAVPLPRPRTPPAPTPPSSPSSPGWVTGPVPAPARKVSPRSLAMVAVAALAVGVGALIATRGHSPRIESFQFPSSIVAGERGNGSFRFSDKKGDASQLQLDPVSGNSFRPLTIDLAGLAGRTSGNYPFWLSSPVAGRVVMKATLVDTEGRKSRPITFTFDITPAPARQSPARKKSFEIQAPNGFKFKVN
jgi:hypothetical protein